MPRSPARCFPPKGWNRFRSGPPWPPPPPSPNPPPTAPPTSRAAPPPSPCRVRHSVWGLGSPCFSLLFSLVCQGIHLRFRHKGKR
ncbi:MAG: hypothetical protein EBQ51_08325 [Verrucomicrobia bacterium]|nr:hypothetical protein [Verrucomicrobiota bacterium]